MSAGLVQAETGIRFRSVTGVQSCALPFLVSVGVKSTFSAWLEPAFSFVPAVGVYTKLPATSAVALSWVVRSEERRVGKEGVAQATTGLHIKTLMETVLLAVW